VPDANEADVDLAVTAAQQAKAAWGKTTGKMHISKAIHNTITHNAIYCLHKLDGHTQLAH
jgi:acyl-CoA reductase-like NAD-dependent aldehyde dehydrogenase